MCSSLSYWKIQSAVHNYNLTFGDYILLNDLINLIYVGAMRNGDIKCINREDFVIKVQKY